MILTRRVGETLMVGTEVTVTVIGVKGNQVRVGIGAPKDVAVHREEIYERGAGGEGGREQVTCAIGFTCRKPEARSHASERRKSIPGGSLFRTVRLMTVVSLPAPVTARFVIRSTPRASAPILLYRLVTK